MGRKAYKPHTHLSHEFELDLAPLLAVMVKLVPVLLVSSAFVSIMMVETELPQAVKEAMTQNQEKPKASIQLDVSSKNGIKIIIENQGKQTVDFVQNKNDGSFDLPQLHQKLVQVKTQYPEVFRLEMNPESQIPYKEIVKIMDEARKARDRNIRFPVYDSKLNKEVETDYMFPDVVFVNIMEG